MNMQKTEITWFNVNDKLPNGNYTHIFEIQRYSQEVLFCNYIAFFIGVYDKENNQWLACQDEIDTAEIVFEVSDWAELPENPNIKRNAKLIQKFK